MRILTGGINHESNSLSPIITGEDDFVVFRGNEIIAKGMSPEYSSTGIIQTLRSHGAEIIPTVLARAVPNGVVSAAFYQKIKNEILDRAREALKEGPIDGICLALHGSMKVQGDLSGKAADEVSAEGDLCTALRGILPGVPFTAALDMHATITPDLLEAVNGFAGYKTAPHTDCLETGEKAAEMLLASLGSGRKLYTAYTGIPMMIAGEKSETAAEPMASLIKGCLSAEKQDGIQAASILLGFPWADSKYNAVTILVTSFEEAKNTADRCARDLALSFWRSRGDFTFRTECYDSRRAMAAAYEAVAKGERPVFVSDSGDNPTAGAAGDATDLLEAIIATMDQADGLPTPLLYSGFYDAEAAAACIRAGENAAQDITLGGRRDTVNGRKIPLRVQVKKTVRDFGPYKSGLALVSYRNLLITITSKHIGFGDEDLLPALGINAGDYCLIAVKLGYLEPCFRRIAARAILASSRGCSHEILENIPYKKVRRPIYPLDPDIDWTP
ncbi:MAG: M81 family metallopeptidase [Treponema sp.]|jgi:microcystin degradation protein MlrC|nr:M81 family metallopeptidase [Treponema sp.]